MQIKLAPTFEQLVKEAPQPMIMYRIQKSMVLAILRNLVSLQVLLW